MALFQKSVERRERIEPTLNRVQTRASDPSWAALSAGAGVYNAGGSFIEPHLAETLGAVVAAVELIAGSIASLPAYILDAGGDNAPATLPAVRLLRQPNGRMTWPAFCRQIVADVLLRGNAVAMIQTDGRGAVSALVPVPFGWLSPQVIDGAGGARLAFDCAINTPAARLAGIPQRMLADDCLHVRARSDDGVLGRSVLSRAGGVVDRALGADQTASAMTAEGWHGQAYLTADGRIDADTVERLRGQVQQAFGGGRNAGQMPILGNGLTIKSLSLNPEQLQLLATREFGVAEVCRLFGIPEPLLQTGARVPADPTPWLALFAQTALAPIVCEIEAAFAAAILPPGWRLVLDMAGLQRGSFSAVAASMSVLRQSGIISANDARQELGFPVHADGDALAAGAPPSWPADGAGLPALSPKPGPTGDGGLPNVGSNENGGSA